MKKPQMSDILTFPDLRKHLVPDTLVFVKIFEQTSGSLPFEAQIEAWVQQTGNLIVIPGPVSHDHESGVKSLAVTYVSAVEANYDVGKEARQSQGVATPLEVPAVMAAYPGGDASQPGANRNRWSDGAA